MLCRDTFCVFLSDYRSGIAILGMWKAFIPIQMVGHHLPRQIAMLLASWNLKTPLALTVDPMEDHSYMQLTGAGGPQTELFVSWRVANKSERRTLCCAEQ